MSYWEYAIGAVVLAIATSLIDYLLGFFLPKEKPTIKRGLTLLGGIITFLAIAWYLQASSTEDQVSSADQACVTADEIQLSTDDVVEVNQPINVSIEASNPQNSSLVFDWSSTDGSTITPSGRTASNSAVFIVNSSVTSAKIFVKISTPGCNLLIERSKNIAVVGSVEPTSIPPTSTSIPPTSTPIPPTSTPIPPTSTPIPPTSTPIPPTPIPIPPTPISSNSSFTSYDAAVYHRLYEKTYFFRETTYFAFNPTIRDVDRTAEINVGGWKGLPPYIDAAVNHPINGKAYFFIGDLYYRFDFDLDKVDHDGGRVIGSDGWFGLPANIDAAVIDPTDNNIAYFFIDDLYYRYDFAQNEVDHDKDLVIGRDGWLGIPTHIDAAAKHPTDDTKVYFFVGDLYYRYDLVQDRVDDIGRVGIDGWNGLYIP